MFKKLKFIFALAMVASIFLTACSSPPESADTTSNTTVAENTTAENTTAENTTESSKLTLTLGIWQGNDQEQAALESVLQNIEEKYDIVVEKKIYTEYETQIKADLAGNVAPDVFYVDAYIAPELIGSGVLEPIPADADFYASLTNAFSDGSNLYGLPKDYSALAVFYDETLLTDAGYTAEDIPKALEDWPAFLTELQAKLPEGVTALSVNNELARLMSLIQTSGSNIYKDDGMCNLDDPNIVAAVQFLGDMYKEDYLQTAQEIGDGWVGDTLGTEKACIVIEGNWMIGHLNLNFPDVKYATLEMPTYNGKNNTMTFTVAYAVNAKSNNKEAAADLVNYLTDAENMKTWCSGAGVLPSRESVAKDMDLENDRIQSNIISGVVYSIPWQSGVSLPIINREFSNWFPKVCTGEMTAEEAMKEAVNAANTDIENLD